MSSEAITRNDLTAILNEVLPPTPSEYKKLLWTNTNPTANFTTTTLLNGTDLTVYDEIEVQGVNYAGFSSIMPTIRVPIGSHGNLIGLAGSTGDSSGTGFLVARGISVYIDRIVIASAMGVTTNGTSWYQNDANMIPLKIYGIKYDYVAPPQAEVADVVVEQGTDGIWTYRKWNGGIAECWGTTPRTTYTTNNAYGSLYYTTGNPIATFPSGLFVSAPSVTATRSEDGSGFGLLSLFSINSTSFSGFIVNALNQTLSMSFGIHAIGKWK